MTDGVLKVVVENERTGSVQILTKVLHEHKWQPATCTEPKTCTDRHETRGKSLGHTWDSWVQNIAPSYTEDGKACRACIACGEEETMVIDNNPFVDVKADRFETPILWAYYSGITSGTGDGTTFSPENGCTRKQVVTFLYRT